MTTIMLLEDGKMFTETITSKTYGKLGGTLMGCALGTVTGLLGGIAFRMISTFGDTGEKK